jgi:hypothetical protein
MAPHVVSTFLSIIDRLQLTNTAAAGASGLAPDTIRKIRATGEAPKRAHCRDAVEVFVSLNRRAKNRAELRFAR